MRSTVVFSILLAVAACGQNGTPAPDGAATPGSAPAESAADGDAGPAPDASERLATLFEQYWEENLELNPIQATFNSDHRYDDRFPNFISPE